MHVVWFKKDLRCQDHPALFTASQAGRVLPVWIEEPAWLQAEDFAPRHRQFAVQCLQDLQKNLTSRGSSLLALQGEAVASLEQLWQVTRFGHLWSHEETGNDWTYQRDLAVADWCRHRGVQWKELPQTGVVRRLKDRNGWATRWQNRMTQSLLPAPEFLPLPKFPESLHCPEALRPAPPHPHHTHRQIGGHQEGLSLLDSFLRHRGLDYTRAMSSPATAFDACSRLSPYLTWGCLSVREVFQTALQHRPPSTDLRWKSALKSFTSRLRWHCHFMQKLEDAPDLEFLNLARTCDQLDRPNPDWHDPAFTAWREGRTGFPMIDACMRALDTTGWINFRMRAMLMSFASHHLWFHWRNPGLHLARLFVDYEPGIHWPQVQMQSGTTGINTLRVYSPAKQARDHDPNGQFIRHWVPELQNVPDPWLAAPETMPEMEQAFANCRIGVDYPAPIIDHATAYRHAHEKLRSLRQQTSARQEANQIQTRHGSRRKNTRSWR